MKVLHVRNVQEALPRGLYLLDRYGEKRDSRNGPVLVSPSPIVTVYSRPWERVLFWPERDANPFFHLYEALWILGGRRDVGALSRFVSRVKTYSDDGITFHGAYGYRLREHFGVDQLEVVIERLKEDRNDRRSVLQLWSAEDDLGYNSKDLPCNTTATVQISSDNNLELTVFCRSNDIIWGAYGANAVQFSMIQEYLARRIGCRIGEYRQISVNYHAYANILDTVTDIRPDRLDWIPQPYAERCVALKLPASNLDLEILYLLAAVDNSFSLEFRSDDLGPWGKVCFSVLKAHHLYSTLLAPEKYTESLRILESEPPNCDWVVAATEWIKRRQTKYENSL